MCFEEAQIDITLVPGYGSKSRGAPGILSGAKDTRAKHGAYAKRMQYFAKQKISAR